MLAIWYIVRFIIMEFNLSGRAPKAATQRGFTGPVLIVSLNTSLDRILVMKDFRTGEVNRVEEEHWVGGGKALNLLRMMQIMGHTATAITAVGGATGTIIKQLLERDALDTHCVFYELSQSSRICDVLVDLDTHNFTVINSQGPHLTGVDINNITNKIYEHLLSKPDYLVLTGSLPLGTPDDFYGQLVQLGSQLHARVVVDATGDGLLRAIQANPWLVKVNLSEITTIIESLARTMNLSLPTDSGAWYDPIVPLGNALADRGVNIVITNGDQGSVAWTEDGRWVINALPINLQNTTGSGDAFLAGLLSNYVDTHDFYNALKWGTAAAANNAEHILPMVDNGEVVPKLSATVGVQPLHSKAKGK